MRAAAATRTDTAISAAFEKVGYQSEQQRLDVIALTAWKRWPNGEQQRYDYFVQCVQREMLTWYLVERTREGLMKILATSFLRSKQPDRDTGRQASGGHVISNTQQRRAPAGHQSNADYGRRSPGATQEPFPQTGTPRAATATTSDLPAWKIARDEMLARAHANGTEGPAPGQTHHQTALGSGQPRDNFEAKFRVRAALSKFDMFEVNGMLVKFMTKVQVEKAQETEVRLSRDHAKRSNEHQKRAAALGKISAGMASPTETVEQAWRDRKEQAEKIIEAAMAAEETA